jgi:hypothetical protein
MVSSKLVSEWEGWCGLRHYEQQPTKNERNGQWVVNVGHSLTSFFSDQIVCCCFVFLICFVLEKGEKRRKKNNTKLKTKQKQKTKNQKYTTTRGTKKRRILSTTCWLFVCIEKRAK